MDYNNNNNNDNNNYNNSYDNGSFSQGNQNPYEQSGTNTEQTYNQSPYIQQEYSSSYGQSDYQTSYNQTNNVAGEEPVSVLDWVGTLLLLMVPCAALIVYLIWAFGGNTKKSKANFCKAYLIVSLISTVLVVILYVIIFALAFATGEMWY